MATFIASLILLFLAFALVLGALLVFSKTARMSYLGWRRNDMTVPKSHRLAFAMWEETMAYCVGFAVFGLLTMVMPVAVAFFVLLAGSLLMVAHEHKSNRVTYYLAYK